MSVSPHDLAVRLVQGNKGVGAAYRAAASPRYFERGYRYGRDIAPPDVPIPAVGPDPVTPLEAYFDAHTGGRGIIKWRHYLEIYDRHLHRFRGQSVGVVEIGVKAGGSLQMWREYLGPQIHVYGIDIDPACREFEEDDVEIFIGDQGNPAFWEQFLKKCPTFDIVIDDGGHSAHQQAVTLESLLPHISPGGVYICEDIHGPFQPFHSFVDGLTRPLNDIGWDSAPHRANALHLQVASVHRYPILTVLEKTKACRPIFEVVSRGAERERLDETA
jgi:hypothetical protein